MSDHEPAASTVAAVRPLERIAALWRRIDPIDFFFRSLQARIGAKRMAWAFLVPNLLIFGTFAFWPMILNFWMAFTGGTSTIIAERPFVGLDNFREILDCPSWLDPRGCPVVGYSFWTGLWNTLFFAAVQVPAMILVATATALVLDRDMKGRGFWRAVYFYPVMLSPVVVAVIWDWILKRRGILNALLGDVVERWNGFVAYPAAAAGLIFVVAFVVALLVVRPIAARFGASPAAARGGAIAAALVLATIAAFATRPWGFLVLADFRPVNWLVDQRSGWPMFWAIFVYSWAHLGFYMLILLAGLQAIPRDLYEAAEMDGTSKTRQLFRITLPLLTPTMIVVVVLSLIRAFQVFDEIWVLTGGGPGQATKMIVQHIYETAFTGDAKRYGVAAASSVLVAGLLLVLTLLQLFVSRRRAQG
ncbi:MAG: sugar ABC transporter permease [Siculibacillus sp.]|nr:sugar ABC transporter permease [Siculibacillus sp.]